VLRTGEGEGRVQCTVVLVGARSQSRQPGRTSGSASGRDHLCARRSPGQPTDELFAHGGRSGQHPTGQHHRGTLLGLTHLVHRTRKVFGRGGHDRHRGRVTFLVGTTDQGGQLGQGERRGRCQLSGQGTGTLVGAVRTFLDRTPLGKDSVAHRPGERAELPTTGNL